VPIRILNIWRGRSGNTKTLSRGISTAKSR